jgi:hypothetical protein
LKYSNAITELGATARRRLAIAGYHEPIVSLLWTRPVQLSLHIAKLSL